MNAPLPHLQMSDGACQACALFQCAACDERKRGLAAMLAHDDEEHGGARATFLVIRSWTAGCPAWEPTSHYLHGRADAESNETPTLHWFEKPDDGLSFCACGKYGANYAQEPDPRESPRRSRTCTPERERRGLRW